MAKVLAQEGAAAITLMGTSLSFYRGAAFNRELTQRIALASGRPAVTMSTAVIEGLRNVGGRRLAVATAYNEGESQTSGFSNRRRLRSAGDSGPGRGACRRHPQRHS